VGKLEELATEGGDGSFGGEGHFGCGGGDKVESRLLVLRWILVWTWLE